MTELGGLGDKGFFSVDISRAPQAIRELESALDELYAIRDESQVLGQVNPGARDDVSVQAATLLARRGLGEEDSFQTALDQGIAEITHMIDALRVGFSSYRAEDESAAAVVRQQ